MKSNHIQIGGRGGFGEIRQASSSPVPPPPADGEKKMTKEQLQLELRKLAINVSIVRNHVTDEAARKLAELVRLRLHELAETPGEPYNR